MDTLLASYNTDLFWLFPVTTLLISMSAFALFASILTFIAWKEPAWLNRYRIQARRNRQQTLFWPSIKSWLQNNLAFASIILLTWPLLALFVDLQTGALPPWYIILGQIILFIYLDDFLYYWLHRTMHRNKWLFRHIHAKHHRFMTPWAITGNYMHPVEFVLTGSLALLGPLLLEAHIVTVWLWIAFRQWEAAEGHCGYDLPISPTRYLPFSDGALHHDYHHAKMHGNYGGFLPVADRLFGTYIKPADHTRKPT